MKPVSQAVRRAAATVQKAADVAGNKPHWNADLYKKNSVRFQQAQSLALLDTLKIPDGAKILDVGCGDGKITAALARRMPNARIRAFDLSEDMIHAARRDYAAIPNLSFSVGDAANFDAGQGYDVALSFFCLQWVPDKTAALAGIARALKPGGLFAGIMTDRNPHLLAIRQKMHASSTWQASFATYDDPTSVIDHDRYRDYAEAAKLCPTSFTERPYTLTFDSHEELAAFLRMVSPALRHLPDAAAQELYFEELLTCYQDRLAQFKSPPKAITYAIKTLLAIKPESP